MTAHAPSLPAAPPGLVLASTSAYRRELLSRLQLPFEAVAPDADETPLAGESPEATARRLSRLKARSVAARRPRHLVIGSDQVAEVDGQRLGKPLNFENARAQLRLMSGCETVFHTGLCLLESATGRIQEDVVRCAVWLRELDDARIERYLRKEQPYDCAGSAKTEGLGISLIARIETDDPNALIGLPLIRLTDMLLAAGVELP